MIMKRFIVLFIAILSICSCNNSNSGKAMKSSRAEKDTCSNVFEKVGLQTMTGTLCIGHEVRSFRPENEDSEYWIVDKTDSLNEKYDSLTGGQKNGKPVKAVLKLEYAGKWTDGFAAEYDGVYFVREIVSLEL